MYKNFVVLFLIFWICISESFQAPLQVNPISLNDLYVCNQYQFEFKLTETLVHAKFELAYRESFYDWIPIAMNYNGKSKDTIVFSVLDKYGNSNIELKYRFENNGILVENGTMPMPAFPQSVYDEEADKNCLSVVFKENTREPINDPLLLEKQIQSSSWENNNKQIATFLNLLNAASIFKNIDFDTMYNAYHNVSLPMCSFKYGLIVSMANLVEKHYRNFNNYHDILFNQTMQALQTQCLSNGKLQMMKTVLRAYTALTLTQESIRTITYLVRQFPELVLQVPKLNDLTIKMNYDETLIALLFHYFPIDYIKPHKRKDTLLQMSNVHVLVPTTQTESITISNMKLSFLYYNNVKNLNTSCLLYDGSKSFTKDNSICSWQNINYLKRCSCQLQYQTNSTERFNLYNNGLSLTEDPFFIVGALSYRFKTPWEKHYFTFLFFLVLIVIIVFLSSFIILFGISALVMGACLLCYPLFPSRSSENLLPIEQNEPLQEDN